MIKIKKRCLDCLNLTFDHCEISGKQIPGVKALKSIPVDCPLVEYNTIILSIKDIENRLKKLEEYFGQHISDCHKPKETC